MLLKMLQQRDDWMTSEDDIGENDDDESNTNISLLAVQTFCSLKFKNSYFV